MPRIPVDPEAVARLLRQRLSAKGLTLADLHRETGKDLKTLSKMYNAKQDHYLDKTLRVIAKALGLPGDAFERAGTNSNGSPIPPEESDEPREPNVDDRLDDLDARVTAMERRFSRVEAMLGQLVERLGLPQAPGTESPPYGPNARP